MKTRIAVLWPAAILIGAASWAQVTVLLDLDADASSGCSVSTADGTVDGIEARLETGLSPTEVVALQLADCVDPGTDSFGPLTPVAGVPLPWPVGVGLGIGGADVVETVLPFAELDAVPATVRLGIVTANGFGAADALLTTDGTAVGMSILVAILGVLEIPAASSAGLALLGLLLAALGAWLLRRRRASGRVAIALAAAVLAPLAARAVAAIILDGDPSDWVDGVDAMAVDAVGDAPGADIVAGFAAVSPDKTALYLRVDLFRDTPPTAVADAATVPEDAAPTTIDVLVNDSDPDGGPISIQSVTQPLNGTVTISGGGADLTYQPNPDFCTDPPGTATDDFTYTLAPGGSSAMVAVTVACVDDPPIAVGDGAGVLEDDPATSIDVLANDTDVDGGAISIQSVTQPSGGMVAITGGGSALTYQPDPDFCTDPPGTATDDFSYTLAPGGSTTTVAVTVTCVDDGPVAAADSAAVTEDDPPATIDVLANDTDVDGGAISIQSVTQPSGGMVAITGGGSALTYQPDPDFCTDPPGTATDDFSYTLAPGGSMATVAVTVACTNDPPTHQGSGTPASFVEDAGPVVLDASITVVDVDDVDLESATLTITNLLDSGFETLAANTGGTSISASYAAPTLTLSGADTVANYQQVLRSVTYDNTDDVPDATARSVSCSVFDGTDPSAPAALTVTVTPVNDPPTVANAIIDYLAVGNTLLRVDSADADGHDTPVPGRVASTTSPIEALTAIGASDVDGPLVPTLVPKLAEATDQGGLVSLDDDGDLFYQPPTGFTGVDTETLIVTDGGGGTTPVTLRITVGGMVWYVEDTVDGVKNPAAGGCGCSTDPFESLAEAEAASGPGDYILLFETDSPLDEGIVLKSGQKLYGQPVEDELPAVLPGGLVLEEIADTDSRPEVDFGSGSAVTVAASVGSLSGIELRHLELAASDRAVDISASGGFDAEVLIADSTLSGLGGLRAVTTATAGTVTLALRRSQPIVGSAGPGLLVDGSAGGTMVISELVDTVVSGATAGDGFAFDTLTFDADPLTATLDPIAAGDCIAGVPGDGVGGVAMRLAEVSGDLVFDTLGLEGAGGLVALGTGELAGTTGLRIAATAATLVGTSGPAIDLEGATANLASATLSSTGSAGSGLRLVDVGGTVVAGAASAIGSSTGDAFRVDQPTTSSALTVSYSGTIANSSGRLIRVTRFPAGTITFDGTSLTDSGGQGVSLVDFDGILNLSAGATAISNSTAGGIEITGASDGTVNVDDTTITNSAAAAIAITDAADQLGGSFDFDNVDVSQATDSSRVLLVQGLSTGGSVSFDAQSSLSATDGTGIDISSNAGTCSITLSGPVDLGTNASRLSDGTAFTMAGNSAGTAVVVPDLDVFTSGVAGLVASGSGSLDVDALSLDTFNGRAIDLAGIVSQVDVDAATCSNASDCVRLAGLGVGSATSFSVVSLSCTGGTCFNSNGGREVVVTGATNSIVATGSTAISLTNTTIGSADVTFRSISSSGAANGIVLDTTGSAGGLKVSGIDGPCGNAPGPLDCDGGTLDGNTVAVRAVSTSNLSLRYMRIQNTVGDAVVGDRVTDGSGGVESSLEILDSSFFDIGSAAATDEVVDLATNKTAGTFNITGTFELARSVVDEDAPGTNNSFVGNAVLIENHSGSLAARIVDSVFRNTPNTADKAVNVIATGTNTTTVAVLDSAAIEVRGEMLFAIAEDPAASLDVDFMRNEVRGLNTGGNSLGAGVAVGVNKGARATFDILDNCPSSQTGCLSGCSTCGFYSNFQDPIELSLNDDATNPGGSLEGRVNRNRVEDSTDTALNMLMDGDSIGMVGSAFSGRIELVDNVVQRVGSPSASGALTGISISIRDSNSGAPPASRTVDLTFRNNQLGTAGAELDADNGMLVNVFNTDAIVNLSLDGTSIRKLDGNSLPREAFHLRARDNATVNATIVNGDFSAPSDDELRIRTENAGSMACLDIRGNTLAAPRSIQLQELAGALDLVQTSSANLSTVNAGATVDLAGTSPNFAVGASCPLPAAPSNP